MALVQQLQRENVPYVVENTPGESTLKVRLHRNGYNWIQVVSSCIHSTCIHE